MRFSCDASHRRVCSGRHGRHPAAGGTGERAAAVTLTGASASRVAADDAALLRPAAVICGSNGCARVHTSRVRPSPPLVRGLDYRRRDMGKGRLEAFSDGVIAIIITIMVLELKVPHGADLAALRPLVPVLPELRAQLRLSRHLLEQPPPHAARRRAVNGGILWANLHLLFWLSLVPFATGWMGENHFAPLPTALYGVVLLMAAIAYYLLRTRIMRTHGQHSRARRARSAATSRARSRRALRRRDPARVRRSVDAARSTCWSR